MVDNKPTFLVDEDDTDSAEVSYSAAVVGFTAAATPTDVFTISGSASKIIRITNIGFTATANTSAMKDVIVLKRSTLNTGGTSAAVTAVKHDSNDAAATAVILNYTANPAALGSLVGNIRAVKYDFVAANLSSSSLRILRWDFRSRGAKPLVLRNANELVAINLNSVTTASNLISINVEWTESST